MSITDINHAHDLQQIFVEEIINKINRYHEISKNEIFLTKRQQNFMFYILRPLSKKHGKYALLSSQSNCSYFYVTQTQIEENADNVVERYNLVGNYR